jgi:putative Mg2+ transporter-C (MgtC) family protein
VRSTLPELSYLDVTIRLLVAAALTGAIGLERELRERAAGLRTHMLVGVGSALFTIVSAYAWTDFTFAGSVQFDPTRIAAQVVAGIGFLGAGVIIRQGLSVRGVTTAAGLWVVAGIGMAAGAGYFVGAVIATAIVLIGLGPFRLLERAPLMRGLRRETGMLDIDLNPGRPTGPVVDALETSGARVIRIELSREREVRRVRAEVELPAGVTLPQLVSDLSRLEDVVAVRTEA